jgi:hypothetical protein
LAQERPVIVGTNDWLFLSAELRHLGQFRAEAPAPAAEGSPAATGHPFAAIVDTARQLRAIGIDLLLVPVPLRAVVYADKLGWSAPLDSRGLPERADAEHRAFYARLEREGVPTLDLTDAFIAARTNEADAGTLCCRQDTHWSPRGCALAARVIGARFAASDWARVQPRHAYAVRPEPVTIAGDLRLLLGEDAQPVERLVVERVSEVRDGAPTPAGLDAQSPVLVLADSHGLVFHDGAELHAQDAGLVDHLALAFGFPVDRIARRGSAATSVRIDLARKAYARPESLLTRKLVIWCFAARELTEADGWRAIPLLKPAS